MEWAAVADSLAQKYHQRPSEVLEARGDPAALRMLDTAVMLWMQAEETLDFVWDAMVRELDGKAG